MATGLAWNLSNPLKPYALFDRDAIRDIPCNWSAWLLDIGDTYASHTMLVAAPLECVTSAQLSGVIVARIKVTGTPVAGQKYPVTFRVVSAGGQQDDQTLYLKITEK